MTIYPTLKVEIAFVNDPYGTLTWTDVSSQVRGQVRVKRGRNFELNKTEAGTATLTLENTDGRFSPLNGSSIYAPYVLPYRPIRITASDGTTTYNVFRGFVERWPQQWDEAGNYGQVDLTAVDGFKTVLSFANFGVTYDQKITADYSITAASGTGSGPYYVRFEEAASPFYTYANTSGSALTLTGTTTLSSASPAVSRQYLTLNGASYLSGISATLGGEMWAKPTALPAVDSDAILLAAGAIGPTEFAGGQVTTGQGGWADGTPPAPQSTYSQASTLVALYTPPANLMTANQASMETDASGWLTPVNATVAYDTTHATIGTHSLKLTSTAASGTMTLESTNVPAVANQNYVAHLAVYRTTASASVGIKINFYDGSGTLLGSTSTSSSSIAGTSVWAPYAVSGSGPTGTASMRIQISIAVTATGQTAWIDAGALYATNRTVGLPYWAPGDTATRWMFKTAASGGAGRRSESTAVTLNAWHHLAWMPSSGGLGGTSDVHFVNGAALTRIADETAATSPSGATSIGAALQSGTPRAYFTGSLDEVILGIPYASMSSALVMQHAVYGRTPHEFGQQTTGARIGAILDALAWPSSMRSIDTGLSTVQASGTITSATALSLMQSAADDELGTIYLAGDGKFVFKDRSRRNSPSSVATFGEQETPYLPGPVIDFDDTYIYNNVQITQANTNPAVVSVAADSSSNTTYGLRLLARTVSLTAKADLDGQAATLLARYKQPVGRLSTLKFDLKAQPSTIANVLAREIGDFVTVKRRPIGAPVITLGVFIDGIEDVISESSWERSFLLTPQFANSTY